MQNANIHEKTLYCTFIISRSVHRNLLGGCTLVGVHKRVSYVFPISILYRNNIFAVQKLKMLTFFKI